MILLKQGSYSHVSSLIKCHWKRCNLCIKLFSSDAQGKGNTLCGEGPWSIYEEKVSNGTLTKDSHQEKVVQHLEKIYNTLKTYERPLANSRRGGILSFFMKSKPEKIIAPQGLYIYGSVGGGKTMLMDLFYETVPVSCLFVSSKSACSN